MSRLTSMRIKLEDGTYSNEVPISATAENIAWDNTHTLVDILGSVDMRKGDIQTQINNIVSGTTPVVKPLTEEQVNNIIALLE